MSEIRRAVVKSYDAAVHKADVQIAGSLAVWLDAVRVATSIPAADVVSGRQCTVLFLDPSNQDDAVIITIQGALPSVGDVLIATTTSDLTLTTTAQSITGDGDSSKVRILLPTPGDWLIEATFYFIISTADPDACVGELFVNDSGTAETDQAILWPQTNDLARATVAQRWKVTTTAADTPVELKARKTVAAGTALAARNTTLSAIASGGNAAGAADPHGSGSHTVPYGPLAAANAWAALQTFNAGIQLAAGQAIKDSGGADRILVSASSPYVTLLGDAAGLVRINTGSVGADIDFFETDIAGDVHQTISGLGSGGSAQIQFGRVLTGTNYALYLAGNPIRLGGTLEITFPSPGVILNVNSIGSSAGSALDSVPLSAELDLTATAAQTGKVWSALKSRLTFRGTSRVPDARALDVLVTRNNTAVGADSITGITAGWANHTTSGFSAFGLKTFRALHAIAPTGSANIGVKTDVIGLDIEDQSAKGGVNIYGIRIADIASGTIRHLIEAGPATPYLRLIGGASPAANLTNLYLDEGGNLRRVQWIDPGAGGANFVGGERVMVLV